MQAGLKVLHKSATIRHALKACRSSKWFFDFRSNDWQAQEAGVDIIEIVGYEGLGPKLFLGRISCPFCE